VAQQAGQQFDSATLSWRIKEQADFTMVELKGELNESADLDRLRRRLKGHVILHLGSVRRINSGGVREWVNFIRDLTYAADVTLSHCSPAIVTQLNMIYNFRGSAKVRSFLAPYTCSRCDREEEMLIDPSQHFPTGRFDHMPDFNCNACGGTMEFDEVADRYLGFLRE
jgi:hypothetical protein